MSPTTLKRAAEVAALYGERADLAAKLEKIDTRLDVLLTAKGAPAPVVPVIVVENHDEEAEV